ncbi:MAG TPA: carboxypeptidase-like regulatory domain-containing protein [Terriglobales bacterium]|nr:carboxypeptidase-like regulatory domain-containing protein [Terriglobales bacterium]
MVNTSRGGFSRLLTSALVAALVAMVSMFMVPTTAWGQAMVSGSLGGQVTDPTGAVVPGAIVTVTDKTTKTTLTATSNHTGGFLFPALKPGTYDVSITKSGFQKLLVPSVTVSVSQATTLNETLTVGTATQTVEVVAGATAQLQTMNATMGQTLSGDLMNLPTVGHDVAGLLNYQATAAPTFHGTYGDITSGSVAGSTPDQNTFILDGATNTSGLEGDNGYINSFSGSQAGVVPVPVESIQEVTVNTNNSTADFGTSSGAEMLAVTKRGTDAFHGSAFDFFQGDFLNANTWDFNRRAIARPKSHENFFGFDAGGPILPKFAGGRTYMYFDYEGLRNPDAIVGSHTRTVPSDMLRQGIIQINTKLGVESFDLNNPASLATACGPAGGMPCDPRATGMSSVVSAMWSKFMPEPNSFNTNGDKLNTFGFQGNLTEPQNNNELIGRIDHNFGSKLHFTSRYTWYKQDLPTTDQLDIGGLLPGDKLGTFASGSSNNNQPAQFVAGLEVNLASNLTNSFHFGYTKNGWNWLRNGNLPQFAGEPGPIEIDGESTNALIPVNVNTQNSRQRTWQEHNYDFRDELAWVKGNHFLTFGGDVLHEWWHFDRYDNVVGGLTVPVIEVDNASVNISSNFIPQNCAGSAPGATATSQCIDAGDPSEIATWKQYYADILGIVNHSSVVATRSGANLSLNPLGTPARSFVWVNTPGVYFTDTWRVKPSLTVSYGLNWQVQLPPHDLHGSQDVLVDANNNPITYDNFRANAVAAANDGQIYAPVVGFSPVGAVGKGSKYAFRPFYGQFGPRVSVAWNPTFNGGFLSTFFGHDSTVIRAGYSRVFGRDLGINIVSTPVLGYGFLQPDSCIPSSPGSTLSDGSAAPACASVRQLDPTNAFRIGTNADGTTVPFGALQPTLPSPVQPGVGVNPGAELLDSMDQNFRPNDTDQVDLTIQRQLKGNAILEVGYVGVWGHNLFQGIDMNTVPWMLKLGNQTFANAWSNVFTQVTKGQPVTAQPFFETALGGPTSTFCTGSANCSAALAASASSFITTDDVTDFFSLMETSPGYILPPALYTDTGQSTAFGPYVSTSDGFSNYQALVVKLTKHTSHGLTLNSNFTYGHALGTIGLAQTYTLDTPDNVYNLRADWTPQPWDRKFTFNALGTYVLPFGEGQRWLASGNPVLSRLVSGWSVSPIFTYGSGLPNEVFSGGLEMGAGFAENGSSAVQLNPSQRFSNSPVTSGISFPIGGTSNPNNVGINSNASRGGDGANVFGANAINVYNSFRPFVLGIDGSPSPDGNLRSPQVWELDFGVTKDTRITERIHAQFFMQSQNFFNHNNWGSPSLNLQDPHNFGTISGGLTGPRIIQLGARVAF